MSVAGRLPSRVAPARRPARVASALRAALVAMAILAAAGGVAAHEEGVLRLGSPTASPGREIEVRGERLPRSSTVRLELRGALDSRALGEVATDERGGFATRLLLPTDLDPGRYRLLAFATDGDEVARVDLIILAAPPPELVPAEAAETVHATSDEMELDAALSPPEWAAILAFVVACAAGGLVLLRRPSASAEDRA